jgi:hypothetical protein
MTLVPLVFVASAAMAIGLRHQVRRKALPATPALVAV